ncbi:MAG: hypothetical protein DCF15_04185 [Phormidesmis priestleyi]|uniref:Uncharacterized protein n=1 Tax=Phormidesmis priestleyi TaxID=268141 RepID=A0A2W4XP47_9CYAN|nr:MAG: hypothetical protein DCF15_04185 [Phormidesmis priestleyi]
MTILLANTSADQGLNLRAHACQLPLVYVGASEFQLLIKFLPKDRQQRHNFPVKLPFCCFFAS